MLYMLVLIWCSLCASMYPFVNMYALIVMHIWAVLAWECCVCECVCVRWSHPVSHVWERRTQGGLFRSDLPGTGKHPPQRASHTQASMACQHHLTWRFIFSTGRVCVFLCAHAWIFASIRPCVSVHMYVQSVLGCIPSVYAHAHGAHVQASVLWCDGMINRLISALSGAKQCSPEASSAWTCVGIQKQRSIVCTLEPHEADGEMEAEEGSEY